MSLARAGIMSGASFRACFALQRAFVDGVVHEHASVVDTLDRSKLGLEPPRYRRINTYIIFHDVQNQLMNLENKICIPARTDPT